MSTYSEIQILRVYETYISERCYEVFRQVAYKNATILDLNDDPNIFVLPAGK